MGEAMIRWLKSIFHRRAYGEWHCEVPIGRCFVCKDDGFAAHEFSSWRIHWKGDFHGLIIGALLRHPGANVSVEPVAQNEYRVRTFKDITDEVEV
jgi:hypothetical protein